MESMKRLWVVIGVCSCWLAFLVQQQQCMELFKETTEIVAGSMNNIPDNHHFTSLLSSVVSHDGNSEPKVHITGFNGLCATVPNGDYHDGNGIVLDECKDGKENQLWTLRSSDQTIRSGGKCMTTYGYSSRNYVMIYNCHSAVEAATKWEVRSDSRRIVNPISGLFLTAERDPKNGVYTLVVEYNHYVPRQAWVPTNNTKPRVTKIRGLNSLCLTLDGVQRVEMAKCGQNVTEQKWAVYLDGTIRPEKDQGRCLRFEYGQYVVSVGTCGGWTNEPWVFQDSGILLHLATGKVMDIKATPNGFSPFLNCYDGSASQIWSMTAP